MTKPKNKPLYTWRYCLVFGILSLGLLGLVWRMIYLTVIDRDFLQTQGDARTLRVVNIPAYRGMITDRNGEPLAISTPVNSVWLNPQQFRATKQHLEALSKILGITVYSIKTRVKKNKNREFIYLKRRLTPALAAEVKDLKIPGIGLRREFRRYYPEGKMAAHIVGFTNIDDQGQEGIELEYNNWLRGSSGQKRVLRDRLGRVVADVDIIREARPGRNLALSIDRRIQYLAYRTLSNAMQKYKAASGSVVVLDAKTDEILAMVNQPSFNPNKRVARNDGRYRNRAVTDVFEPGSTIKAFSVANALDSGKFKPDTKVDTSPGWIVLGGHTVKDARDNKTIDVTTILKRSSNVGVSKLTLALAPESLWKLLHRVGFGMRTGLKFPGESAGSLPKQRHWTPFSLATLSFGYGVSVTPLQLAQAYSILASNGMKHQVSLLRQDKVSKGRRVVNKEVAQQVKIMLESVVQPGGTATRAQVPSYRVAGKTGTVRMVGPGGYEEDHHVALFAGMAPASDPRLVIVVVINDPQGGQFYGGQVAAPVFAKVMGGALRLLDISPDDRKRLVA